MTIYYAISSESADYADEIDLGSEFEQFPVNGPAAMSMAMAIAHALVGTSAWPEEDDDAVVCLYRTAEERDTNPDNPSWSVVVEPEIEVNYRYHCRLADKR